MDDQPQLTLDSGDDAPRRTEPRFWVKELAVYRDFKPDAEMRRITLRPGLNIIWARDSISGASGHAAGKSTFCRMLRYLIGDVAYGTDQFRAAFRLKFPDACLMGEVWVDGTPWLIVRPLNKSGYHWCSRGGQWDSLFTDELKHQDYHDFTTELDNRFIKPLGIKTFPGTQKNVAWVYLLQWLTRDQDARYSHLLEWRPSAGDSTDAKFLTSGDKTNLIRMVIGLLTPNEQVQQDSHADLLSVQSTLDGEIPNLVFSRNRTIAELKGKSLIPNLGKMDIGFALAGIAKELDAEVKELEKHFQAANLHDGVGEVIATNLKHSTQRRTELESSHKGQADHLKLTRMRLRHQKGEISREELLAQSAELGDIKGKCSNSLEMAHAFSCPIAPLLERDELQTARIHSAKSATDHLEAQLSLDEHALALTKRQLDEETTVEKRLTDKAAELKTAHAELRAGLHKQLTDKRGTLNSISRAIIDDEEIETKRDELKNLRRDITASTKKLASLRKESSKRLSELSNQFSEVASFLLNQKVNGSVRFNSDEVIPDLNYDGDMSSAALVTLRLLIFDLACLIGSVGPFTLHPGFLLHDSPREADLSASIYRRIFTLIAGDVETEAVQYIIATTEGPPEDRQSKPWLVCDPLSSANPADRFLKTII